ncbi:MAG: universal stress protein [Desulfobacterales bacterium]|nr:universal stress protein [Desulfobacterales bacterium]MDX2509949.1 universal stress protein [Desulfobacterales bacterium]
MKLNKFLVPVDGSDYSMRAAKYAAELAKLMGGKIVLMHCHKSFPVVLGEPHFQNAINKIMEKSNKLVEPYRKLFQETGTSFVERILEGPAANAICEVAKLEKLDMIVIGSRGRNKLEGLLLGSCTQRVLNMASCPVLVIR